MSEVSRVSRRGLFTLGAVRVAEAGANQLDPLLPEPARPAPDRDRPAPDRDDWSARQATARAQSHAGDLWAPAATTMLDALHPRDGERLLAAGDGDAVVALNAARAGWSVAACDDLDPLVGRGRGRCAAAQWLRADLHRLPFDDASFDCVASCFSPMFCPEAQDALGELCRVVRPGGTVTITAWKRSGLVGRLLLLAADHDPVPRGIIAPVSWGREASMRPNLRAHCDHVEFEHRTLALSFDTREAAIDRLLAAVSPLAAVPDPVPFRDAMRALVDELAGQDEAGATILPAPYILVRAVRREPTPPSSGR